MVIQPGSANPALRVAPSTASAGAAPPDRFVSGGDQPGEVKRATLAELAGTSQNKLFSILEEALSAVRAAPLSSLDQQRLEQVAHDIPKVDLHRHLEGAIEPEVLVPIAQKHNIPLPSYNVDELRPHIQITENDKTLLDFLKKFEPIGPVFLNREVIADITHGAISDANKDNVKYLELRYSPQYMAKAHNLDLDDVVKGVFDGVQRAAGEFDTKVGLTLIVERWDKMERAKEVEELAARHKDKGIVALDLANDEFHYPPGPFAEVFQDARKAGLKITVHAGEAGGAENVRSSIEELGADRIGHGVRTYQDPAVEQLVIDRKVPLELCPTSNVQTGAIERLEDHPLKRYFDKGIPVTVNTDDPAISGITLSHDVALVTRQFGFSLNDLRAIQQNGIDAAFTEEGVKQDLSRSFDHGFAAAERNLVGSLTLDEFRKLALEGVEAAQGGAEEKAARRARVEQEIDAASRWLTP